MIEVREQQPDAVYERELDASVERIWENVLDWEHLPYLHSQTFSSVRKTSGDRNGWRGEVGLVGSPGMVTGIDVVLDRPGLRYDNRTISGVGEGTGILTHLFPRSERRTGIRVEFRFPWAAREAAAGIGEVYRSLYVQLWDQDEEMMLGRQRALDARRDRVEPALPLHLGSMGDLAARLPLDVEAGGRRVRVVRAGGRVLAFDTACPHLGGPLREEESGSCFAVCPWHGYRFDLASGLSADGKPLRLAAGPRVEIDVCSGEATLHVR